MLDNMELVLNKYDLLSVFVSEGDEFKSVNSEKVGFTEKQLKQSLVVLKQTLFALQGVKFKKMIISGEGAISAFLQNDNRIIGYVAKVEINEDEFMKSLNSSVAEGRKVEPVAEREEKAEKEIQEKTEKLVEKKEEQFYDAEVLPKINAIVEEYLEDFAIEIIENVKEKVDLKDEDKYTSVLLMQYVDGIEQSASMLIGPTRAEEMKNKIKKLLD